MDKKVVFNTIAGILKSCVAITHRLYRLLTPQVSKTVYKKNSFFLLVLVKSQIPRKKNLLFFSVFSVE